MTEKRTERQKGKKLIEGGKSGIREEKRLPQEKKLIGKIILTRV